MGCPNKNTKLYKRLSTQFSKENTYKIWDSITSDKFNQWYGDRRRDSEGMPEINRFFEIYNNKLERVSLFRSIIKLDSVEDVEKLFSSQKTKGIDKYNNSYYITKSNRVDGKKLFDILNYYYPGLLSIDTYKSTSEALGNVDQSEPVLVLNINEDFFYSQDRVFLSPKREESIIENEPVTKDVVSDSKNYIVNRLKEYSERLYSKRRDAQREYNNTKDQKYLRQSEQIDLQLEEIKSAIKEIETSKTVNTILDTADKGLDYAERLLNQDYISESDLIDIYETVSLYRRLSDISDNNKMGILTEEDLEPVLIEDDITGEEKIDLLQWVKRTIAVSNRAEALNSKFEKQAKALITKIAEERFGKKYTEEQLFKNIKDVSGATRWLRDLASAGNTLLSLLSSFNNDASRMATQESVIALQNKAEMTEGLKKSSLYRMLGHDNFMKLLWQEDSKGNKTGGLVNRYSEKYWQKRRKYYESMRSKDKTLITKAKKEHYDTHEYVNYFETEEQQLIELERLSEHFGIERAKELIEEMSSKFEEYREAKAQQFAIIDVLNISAKEKEIKKELWEIKHDPQKTIENLVDGIPSIDPYTQKIISNSFEYVKAIPRKVSRSTGEDTGFYDKNYEKIATDAVALGYLQYVKKTLGDLYSYYPQAYLDEQNIHSGFIPQLKKDILKKFIADGLGNALQNTKELMRGWYSIQTFSNIQEHIDPGTGVVRDAFNIKMLSPKYTYLQDETRIIETNNIVTDIDKILDNFIPLTNMYKHKSRVEASHRLLVNTLNSQIEGVELNPQGKAKINGKKDTAVDTLANLKAMVQFGNEVFFEKHQLKREQASSSKLKLTPEQKTEIAKIDSRLEQIEEKLESGTLTEAQENKHKAEKAALELKKSDIGKSFSWTRSLKSYLRYYQTLALGWSITAPSIELLYGSMSNFIHSSGGRDYTSKQMRVAYAVALGATTPATTKTNTSKKFKALVDKFDVVGEVADFDNNRFKNSRTGYNLKRALQPHEMMRLSDRVSKGSVMVAVMLNTKVTNNKGEEATLWEAYNEKGELKEEFLTDENIKEWAFNPNKVNSVIKLSTKIAQINKRNHGNYDVHSQIEANASALGKSLIMFRRWMFEGFATRFEKESYNENLDRVIKGRFRTYADVAREFGGGYKGYAKSFGLVAKALSYKFMPGVDIDAKLIEAGVENETDLENIRKNASGLMWTVSVWMFLLMLKSLMLDDDDERQNNGKFALNFLLNQGGRLQQDLFLYVNPSTATDVTKNFVPSFALFQKLEGWFEAATNTFFDLDPEYHTTYQRGEFKGESKLMIKSFELIPGTAAWVKTVRNVSKLYD